MTFLSLFLKVNGGCIIDRIVITLPPTPDAALGLLNQMSTLVVSFCCDWTVCSLTESGKAVLPWLPTLLVGVNFYWKMPHFKRNHKRLGHYFQNISLGSPNLWSVTLYWTVLVIDIHSFPKSHFREASNLGTSICSYFFWGAGSYLGRELGVCSKLTEWIMSHLVWGDTSEIARGVRVVEEFENCHCPPPQRNGVLGWIPGTVFTLLSLIDKEIAPSPFNRSEKTAEMIAQSHI